MLELHRLTSEYIETEDRFRLTGEDQDGNALCLWLTQRLALRMIAHLVNLITKGSPEALQNPTQDSDASDLLQSFAQEQASSTLVPQAAVDFSKASDSILVNEVDISRTPEGVVGFVFKGNDTQVALGFEPQQLRQWLTIMHTQWIAAEWPVRIWPQWIAKQDAGEDEPTAKTKKAVH
jgi:hypothetical protein